MSRSLTKVMRALQVPTPGGRCCWLKLRSSCCRHGRRGLFCGWSVRQAACVFAILPSSSPPSFFVFFPSCPTDPHHHRTTMTSGPASNTADIALTLEGVPGATETVRVKKNSPIQQVHDEGLPYQIIPDDEFVATHKASITTPQTYMNRVNLTAGAFFWTFPPSSYDTGGFLNDDWQTLDQRKLDFLTSVQPSPSNVFIC